MARNIGKKINDAIDWLVIGSVFYFMGITVLGMLKRKSVNGIGVLGQRDPIYSKSLLERYLNSVPVFDATVNLNPADMNNGKVHILCGDSQGGRAFYTSLKNVPILKEYLLRHNGDYEEGYYVPF